jgi:hypothetical protein
MFRLVGALFGGPATATAAAQPTPASAAAAELPAAAPAQPDVGGRATTAEGGRQSPAAPCGAAVAVAPRAALALSEHHRRSPRLRVDPGVTTLPRAVVAAASARAKLELERDLVELRTSAALFAKKGAVDLPAGFPSGPFASALEAKHEIGAFCANPATAGGGHGVVWGGSPPGCSTHGPHKVLLCHEHGDKGKGCKWRLTLEQCVEGWCLYSQYGEHNHELAQSVAEANVHRSMRDIPADLLQVAKDMVSSGISVAGADRYLRHQVAIRKEEPTWTYQDVYHATGASTRERAADATGFSELLFEREHKQGLFHRLKTDSDGCLSHAFFVMPGAEEIWAVTPDYNVVLYDTKVRVPRVGLLYVRDITNLVPSPQHGTNNPGLKMAAYVTVDATGATKALAYSFLLDESNESHQWSYECFKDAFRTPPAVIFTDSDPGMKVAIAAVFPDAEHLLCVWHLSKNMFTHIKAACGNDDAMWKRMLSTWWCIVKQSDLSSRETFDEEWARLTAMLDESTVTGKSMLSARKWLAKMAEEKEHWAYRWTWQHMTMGIHSTQRIESLHAHIMGYLRASTLLVELVPRLELYGATVMSRAETRDNRHIRL